MNSIRPSVLPLLVAAALMLVGCSNSEPMAEVSGMVTVGTTPVEACSVQFHPEGGGRPVATSTEDGGHYRLVVPPGSYRVVVRNSYAPPAGWKEGDPLPEPSVVVPKEYTQSTTTKLQVTVERPEDVTKDLQL